MNNADQVSDCLHTPKSLSALNELEDDVRDRIKGMIAGNIIGDMLGITTSWSEPLINTARPLILPKNHQRDIIGGGVFEALPGDWTDDTSMLLALSASLQETGGVVDPANERKQYEAWFHHGVYTPHNKAYDIGDTTRAALEGNCSPSGERDNGNGGLMRSSVIAAYYRNRSAQIAAKAAEESCAVTHGHPIARTCNGIYILILQSLLNGDPLRDALTRAERFYKTTLPTEVLPIFHTPTHYPNSGYCVDTLQTAFWVLEESENFEESLIKTIHLGGDADTIGAVNGALAGAYYGFQAIPERWKVFLDKVDVVYP